MSPNIPASIKQRLLNLTKAQGQEFEYTLVRYACERFLFRLGKSAHGNKFILKGAALFIVWTELPYRGTRDVDLLLAETADQEIVRRIIRDVCAVECPEDGIIFDASSVRITQVCEDQAHAGLRVRFWASLGQARIPLQIDIGFGDTVHPPPEEIAYPVMLDLPAPRLKIYPKETVISEKFCAMVELGVTNSRMKDFFDVIVIAREFGFEGDILKTAIEKTFAVRGLMKTGETPDALTPAFYENPVLVGRWKAFLTSGKFGVGIPSDFGDVGEKIRAFLVPVYEALIGGSEFRLKWMPGGPWR